MVRMLLAIFFQDTYSTMFEPVYPSDKKKRGTCYQIPRSRARYAERRVLPAISAAATTATTAAATTTAATEAAGAWSLRLGLIDSQCSPP